MNANLDLTGADRIRVVHPLFQAEGGGSIPTSALQLEIAPIGVVRACELNLLWHSRLPNIPRTPGMFAFGAMYDGLFYAVGIWSGPVARMLNGQNLLELRRMAVAPDAPRNTPSRMLRIMRLWIRTKRPEVVRLISYQDTEVHTGTIYKAAGWEATTITAGDEWTRPNRYRKPSQTTAAKVRWECAI